MLSFLFCFKLRNFLTLNIVPFFDQYVKEFENDS